MDSRTIKIETQVYNELDRYRLKGETFSDAVRKLLTAADVVSAAASALGPVGRFEVIVGAGATIPVESEPQ